MQHNTVVTNLRKMHPCTLTIHAKSKKLVGCQWSKWNNCVNWGQMLSKPVIITCYAVTRSVWYQVRFPSCGSSLLVPGTILIMSAGSTGTRYHSYRVSQVFWYQVPFSSCQLDLLVPCTIPIMSVKSSGTRYHSHHEVWAPAIKFISTYVACLKKLRLMWKLIIRIQRLPLSA